MSRYLAFITQRAGFRVLFLVLAGLAALLAPETGARAGTTFDPSWSASLANPAPGVSSDVILEFGIEAPQPNFSRVISFVPPEFDIAGGGSIPNGAYVGTVESAANLGLIGNACTSSINVDFQLMDASIDPDYSIPPYNGTEDSNGNGLPDSVDYYPALMSLIAPGIEPIQRLYGQSLVSGTQIPLNFIIFAPGTQIPLLPAFDASLGYPTITIVGDPFAVPETSFPVTDFCTPLATTVTLNGVSKDNPGLAGNQGGYTLRTNPPEPGAYNSIVFARSQWDTDGDGIENNIDPCALTPDPGWNPRLDGGPGDADGDGLPDSCDPMPSSFSFDNDGDQYPNRGDYCPTVAANWIHYDRDHDTIGDDCDPFPDDETNNGAAQRQQVCLWDVFIVGSPASSGPPSWSCPDGPDLEVPPSIDMFPENGVELVGSVHSLHVSVDGPGLDYNPAPGVTVDFEVSGANPGTGSCLTANWGECEFNYVGTNEGTDTITATAVVDGFSVEAVALNEWVTPPENDDFSDAIPVTGIPFGAELAMTASTVEQGEPQCGFGGTVWYTLTPEADAFVSVEIASVSTHMALGAFTGSAVDQLQMIDCAGYGPVFDDAGGAAYPYDTYVGFAAQAGETYHIQVTTFDVSADLGEITIDYASPGDANCSGSLNALDALEVLRKNAGLPSADCAGNGDMNCDEVVNAVDALMILRVVALIADAPGVCLAVQN